MDKLPMYVLLSLFILTFLALVAVYLYNRYFRRKYTREYFAFFAVTSLASFMLAAVTVLMVRNPLTDMVIELCNAVFGTQMRAAPPQELLINAGLILLCTLILERTIAWLYHNWGDVKSTRQVEFEETGRTTNVWQDARFYTQVWRHKTVIDIAVREPTTHREVFPKFEPDDRPWHIKAAHFFTMLDRQYDIHVERDWYGEYQCYIAQYGQEDEKIAVLCLTCPPTGTQLEQFLTFTQSRQGRFHKYIVALSGTGKQHSESYRGCMLEYRYETEMLESMLVLSPYQRFIERHFTKDTLENSDLTLANIYVPLTGRQMAVQQGKLEAIEAIENVEQFVLNWVKRDHPNRQNEHLVLLGDYGQGKTVLTQKIVREMLAHPEDYTRIPILIELRGLSPRTMDELGILGQWAHRYNASAPALWELHRTGKLLIIFDGFDEMDLVGDTELLFRHFTQLWTLARVPKSKILLTGRPNLFVDDQERRRALGIQEPRTHLPYARAIYLDALSQQQIGQALRHVAPATQRGILEALAAAGPQSTFAELIRRPSTLYQLSTVWDQELAKYQERLNSAIVIGSFLQKTYEREEHKGTTELTAHERSYFMMGIATAMMLRSGYTNLLRSSELKDIVDKLWDSYPPNLPPYEDAMAGQRVQDHLRHRMRENPAPQDTILRSVQVGGVLVQDLSGRDVFRFAHKSYMEYLVSAFFIGFILQNQDDRLTLMKVNAIARATRFTRAQLVPAEDVERFAAELVAARIVLTDQQGRSLPVQGHEREYARTLFYSLTPYRIARWCPNITGWLCLHPALKFFVMIGILATIVGGVALLTKEKFLIEILGMLLVLWLFFVFLYRKSWKKIIFPQHMYINNLRIYRRSCSILNCQYIKISECFESLIQEDVNQDVYEDVVIQLLACCVYFSGILASAGVGAGIIADAFTGVGAVLGASVFANLFASVFASVFAGAGAGAGAGVIAGVIAGAGVIVFTDAGAFAVLVTVSGAGVGAGLSLWLKLRRAVKKLKKGMR